MRVIRCAVNLTETIELIKLLASFGVAAVNISCGSPYYNPHIQRPAAFPPSDGYHPPEDPLVGVARQIHAARECKLAVPEMPIVGTGYSYLQDYLPHVAQAVVRAGWADLVGLGRMVLSYPELPADVLAMGKWHENSSVAPSAIAPRRRATGWSSGCYPLDPYYRQLPEAERLRALKKVGR